MNTLKVLRTLLGVMLITLVTACSRSAPDIPLEGTESTAPVEGLRIRVGLEGRDVADVRFGAPRESSWLRPDLSPVLTHPDLKRIDCAEVAARYGAAFLKTPQGTEGVCFLEAGSNPLHPGFDNIVQFFVPPAVDLAADDLLDAIEHGAVVVNYEGSGKPTEPSAGDLSPHWSRDDFAHGHAVIFVGDPGYRGIVDYLGESAYATWVVAPLGVTVMVSASMPPGELIDFLQAHLYDV